VGEGFDQLLIDDFAHRALVLLGGFSFSCWGGHDESPFVGEALINSSYGHYWTAWPKLWNFSVKPLDCGNGSKRWMGLK
jgi:hypothetical protein